MKNILAVLFLAGSLWAQCPAPFAGARCDLATIAVPSTPPQVGSNTCTAGSLQACGNLIGAGTTMTDPFFGTSICRVTDASTSPYLAFSSMSPSISGSGEELHINYAETMIDAGDNGGRDFPMNWTWCTAATPMYATTLSGGFFTAHQGFEWAHNSSTPNRGYVTGNGINNVDSGYGTLLGWYDFTGNTPTGTPPTFTQMEDYTASGNCLPSGFVVNYATGGGSGQTDTHFSVGFGGGVGTWVANTAWNTSNLIITILPPQTGNPAKHIFQVTTSGTTGATVPTWPQSKGATVTDGSVVWTDLGTGGQSANGTYYVGVYVVGSGCRLLNVYNFTVGGDWGPTGTATGTACAGNQSLSTNTNNLHNVKIYKVEGSTGTTEIDFGSACGSPSQPDFYWQYAAASLTNSFNAQCTSECTGHETSGLSTWVNNPGNNPPNYIMGRTLSNLTPFGIVPNLPTAGYPSFTDYHFGWNALNDSYPFFTSSYITNCSNIAAAWQNEILAYNPAGTENPYRFAHTFNTSCNGDLDFDNQIAVGSIATKGDIYLFTSNWMNTLGSNGDAATCVPFGPSWAASTSYPSFLENGGWLTPPASKNAGHYSYQATTAGTSGATEPAWTQTPGATINDGTVVWTASTGAANCRGDVFAVKLNSGFSQSITAVAAPVRSTDQNNSYFETVIGLAPAYLSSQTPKINGGLQSAGADPIAIDTEITGGVACSPVYGDWSALDSVVAAYKTNFIIIGADEGNSSTATPICVWSQAQANAAALTWTASTYYTPGQYVNVSGTYYQIQTGCPTYGSVYSNSCESGTSTPSWGTSTVTDNQVTWVKLTGAPLQDGWLGPNHTGGCNNSGNGVIVNLNSVGVYTCPLTSSTLTLAELYNAMPIPELPYWNWYQQIIANVISHYNASAYLSQIGYFRFGFPMGGELGGLGLTIWPYTNYPTGGYAQLEAQYMSWVATFDAYIMAQSPKMLIFSDINSAAGGGSQSINASYADQEAILANQDGMAGIGNQDYNDQDRLNLTGATGYTTKCSFPLTAASGCTQGDWAYNFATFPNLYHELQTLVGSSPLACNPNTIGGGSGTAVEGGLASVAAGTNCTAGSVGLLPFLVNFCSTGISGQKVCTNVAELDSGSYAGTSPSASASDILLAFSPTYASTANAIPQYAASQAAYLSVFCQFLGNSSCSAPSPCSTQGTTTAIFGLNLISTPLPSNYNTLINANWTCIDNFVENYLTGGPCSTASLVTTNFGFNIPANGTPQWNFLLNKNFSCFDSYLAGRISSPPCAVANNGAPPPYQVPEVTPNFGLILPLFTQQGWQSQINQNFTCIDNFLYLLIG